MKHRLRLFLSLAFFSIVWVSLAVRTAGATTVTAVAAGNDGGHSLFLASDGSLWGMGFNFDGELGDGTTNNVFSPEPIAPADVTNIAAGGYMSFFIKSDGSLWGTGYNYYGELGDGSTNNRYSPVEIVSNEVIAVAAGDDHTLFIKSGGSLWGMGYNGDGELGLGNTINQASPVEIVPSGVKAIAAGGYHSLFVKSDGSLWGMGYNSSWQLGNGATASQLAPIQLMSNGVAAIAAGYDHSLVVKSNGTLWATGDNAYGELGDGTQNSRLTFELIATGVTAAAAGDQFSFFIKTNASLWSMGRDQWGQLGNAEYFRSLTPFEVVSNGVENVAAGYAHALFVRSGTLWDMGDDDFGQLGDNGAYVYNGEDMPQPVDFVRVSATVLTNAPLTVQFSSATTDFYGSNIVSWNWNFGDGSMSTAQNPVHAYLFQGNYVPVLTATLGNGTNVTAAPAGKYTVAGLVRNGGFETDSFAGWVFPDGQTGVGVYSDLYYVHSGNYGAELWGSSVSLSSMAQTLSTEPGQTYLLSFWLRSDGRTPNEFSVSWNSNTIMDQVDIASNDWVNYQFGVAATATNTLLEFGYLDQPSYLGLDDIGVTPISVTATFIATPTNIIAPQSVHFTAPSHDNSGHTLTNWMWSFGDGANSSVQNPSHVYTSFGTFLPTLLAINNSGAAVVATGPQITVGAPTIDFTAVPTNGAAPLTVQFTSPAVDTGGGALASWSWNFGDDSANATSTNQNPSHSYATQGTFTPALVTADSAGVQATGIGPETITVSGLAVNSSFENYDPNTGAVNDWMTTNGEPFISQNFAHSGTNSLEFYESQALASQNVPTTPGTGYLLSFWVDFAAQYPGSSLTAYWNGNSVLILTNVPNGFWTNGQVYLVATGTNAFLQFENFFRISASGGGIYLDDVSVTPAEIEPFTASPTNGPFPLSVQFTAPTIDTFGHTITSWQWNFGDGSAPSSLQNPLHSYGQLGIYQPTLVATNSSGATVPGSEGLSITVRLPSVQITATPTNGAAPLAVQFTAPATDDSGHTITNWQWDFGDGTTSPLQNPSHIYYADGTNFPTLIGTNNVGIEVVAAGPPIVVAYGGGLLQNGNFQTGDFTDWLVTGTFGYVNPTYGHLGSSSAYFSGPPGSSAFAQTFPTSAGAGYVISFWLLGAGNNLAVSWNGTNLAFPTNVPVQPAVWTNVQLYAIAGGANAILQFSTISNSFSGLSDNIAEISVFAAEVEPVTASPIAGPIPLTVQFSSPGTDTSGNAVATWDWNFRDGSPHSSARNPSHVYSQTGIYYPELNAAFANGSAAPATVPIISAVLPSLQFTASPTNGVAPLFVQFGAPGTDSSGRAVTDWSWNFGDGATSAVQNPLHLYTIVSNYTPTLVATNAIGGEVVCSGPAISIAFVSGAVTNGSFETPGYYDGWTASGLERFGAVAHSGSHSAELVSPTVAHLSQTFPTTPGRSYLLSYWLLYNNTVPTGGEWIVSWNGSVVVAETNFPSFGLWTNTELLVTATTTNTTLDFAYTNFFYLDDVSVLPSAEFTASPTNGIAPLTVKFSGPAVDLAGNAITNWVWIFGDGITGFGQNPSHTYFAAGSLSPSLVYVNAAGVAFNGFGTPLITVVLNSGIVSNGGFETGTFQGWTANAGSISTLPAYAHSGAYGVKIGPSSLQYLSQTLATTPGASYLLACWLDSLNGQPPNEFSIAWNGTTLLDDHNLGATGWQPYEFTVTATGVSTLLKFGFQNGPSYFGFDDVSVIFQSSGTPSLGVVGISVSGANLLISGASGQSGSTYRLLTTTNLALPLSQWMPVLTNTLAASGNFTLTATNAAIPGPSQRFFVVVSP